MLIITLMGYSMFLCKNFVSVIVGKGEVGAVELSFCCFFLLFIELEQKIERIKCYVRDVDNIHQK